MSRQVVNTGSALGDRTGDNGRVAFTKVNENFSELYADHDRTAAEISAGVTTVNYGYPPGDIRRYGTNTTPGTTDMTAVLGAWLSTGGPLHGRPETYLFSSQLTVPANTVLQSGGMLFQLGTSIAGNSPAIVVSSGCRIDVLRVRIATGVTVDRVVSVASDCVIGRIEVVSVDQIANTSDNLDAAVYLSGDDINVGSVKVEKYDRAAVIYNSNRVHVGVVEAESYGTGLLVRESDTVFVGLTKAYTASANATTSPGYNGLLIRQATNCEFPVVSVQNSGEHGVRIGGGITGPSKSLQFGTISVWKPGQCGFKILDDTYVTQFITIGEIHVTDCAATSSTGSNEDPVRIQNTDDITIGVIAAYEQDKTNCGNDGVHINGCQRVKIGSATLFNPLRAGFYISDSTDVARQCRDIEVDNFKLHASGNDGIVIDSPTQSIDHISFHAGYMRDVADDAVVITATAVGNPCIFRFVADGVAGDLWNSNSTSTNLINLIETLATLDSVIHSVTIADDGVATIALLRTEGLVSVFQAGNFDHSGIIAYDAVGTPNCEIRTSGHAATFVVTTGALAGTTGTDGNLTISPNAGNLYIENRTGADRTVRYQFLS